MATRRSISDRYCVLGIDPSFTGTGILLLRNDYEIIYKGVVSTPSTSSAIARVYHIWGILKDVIDDGNPKISVIEGMSFNSQGRSVMDTGYLGYRLREFLSWDLGMPLIEPAPTAVKKFATGAGQCKKELILQQVYKRWGVEFSDNNIADAYVLARIGLAFLDPGTELTKFQEEVISVIRKEVPWYGSSTS